MKGITVRGALLALLACFLWSTAATGIKIGLAFAQPLCFAGLRFLLSGLLLVPFARFTACRLIITQYTARLLLISLFQTILLYVLFFEGMALVPGAVGSILNGAVPLAAAIMSHFFGRSDRLTFRKLAILLLGLAGIVFIILEQQKSGSAGGFTGIIGAFLVLGSCFCSATGNILVSRLKGELDPLALNALQLTIGGLVLFLLSLICEGPPVVQVTPVFLLVLFWLALVSAAGFSIWFYLLCQEGITVSGLNVWKFVIPVFGALLAWALLPGESPRWTTVAGMVTVALAIFLYYARGEKG